MRIKNILNPTFQNVHAILQATLAGNDWQAAYLNTPDRISIAVAGHDELGTILIERKDGNWIEISGSNDKPIWDIIREVTIPLFVDYKYQVVSDRIEKAISEDVKYKFFDFVEVGYEYFVKAGHDVGSVTPFNINIKLDDSNAVTLKADISNNVSMPIQAEIRQFVKDVENFANIKI